MSEGRWVEEADGVCAQWGGSTCATLRSPPLLCSRSPTRHTGPLRSSTLRTLTAGSPAALQPCSFAASRPTALRRCGPAALPAPTAHLQVLLALLHGAKLAGAAVHQTQEDLAGRQGGREGRKAGSRTQGPGWAALYKGLCGRQARRPAPPIHSRPAAQAARDSAPGLPPRARCATRARVRTGMRRAAWAAKKESCISLTWMSSRRAVGSEAWHCTARQAAGRRRQRMRMRGAVGR